MTNYPKLPQQLIRPEIQALQPYQVPDSSGCIKLDAMENPYRWPDALVQSWLDVLRDVEINRYPDPSAKKLVAALRPAMQVPDNMAILLGNGSDELIQMLAMAVTQPDRVILAPEPTFVMYRMIAQVAGMQYIGVPLQEDFSLDIAALEQAIETYQPVLVFLAYPNNPSGNLFAEDELVRIIRSTSGLVIIDEAYAPFTDASFMSRLGEFDNLLVLRTVSKMGLAGLRLGFLVGPEQWLTEIDKTRLPYNINVLTQASTLFAIEHKDILQKQAQQIRADRTLLTKQLAEIEGVTVFPSEANFILFRLSERQAPNVFKALRDQGVLIKNLSAAGGSLADCLRVTVGTPDENQTFLQALKKNIEG